MDDVALQESLDAFAANPKAATATPPPKYDPNGRPVTRSTTFFDASDLANGHYVLHRDSVRKTFHTVIDGVVISLEDATPGKAPIEAADRPENLVDRLVYRRLAEMDKAKLLKARLSQNPWSSDYWALYQGCLGKRYADPKFPGSLKWEENHAYVKQHPVSAVLSSGGAGAIDQLSPAEKYDLLAGDPTGTLATAMWDEGRSYFDSSGSVETWMGICHGWAPASYMMPRPSKTVTVLAADGKTQVRFNPTDIKGLASLLWANANTVTRFIGGRSNDKDPAVDENGRPLSPQVFDTNPGTWHLCVVNQIGVAKRGFVMDATYDYEVWNQPVLGYSYRYFNPQTMRLATKLSTATISRAKFTRDPFRKYRSAEAASFVGIIMEVSYVVEKLAAPCSTDGPGDDAVRTVVYKYDLELDASGRIIGGEWYTGKCHPDFLWTPPGTARAIGPAEQFATGGWTPGQPLPESWRKAAVRSAESGIPLAKIIESLISFANT
ncbi:MAG TPA: hypothetical protein PLY80_08945 [Pseudomonadota bacterium]|nr:hypothetical protein [Pseudomonadota bacterium]